MNQKLFEILFYFANKTEYRKKTIIFLTKLTCNLFFILYILCFIYLIFNFKNYSYIEILKYIFIPLFTFLVARTIRINVKAKRPFENMKIKSLILHKGGNSFPSNHSASAMVLAITLGNFFPSLFFMLIILAILTGILRIMVGVHYPIDVLGGFLIGLCFGYIGFFILF